MELPSQEEQLIAEEYVLRRPLPRPDTDWKKAVLSIAIFLSCTITVGFLLHYLFFRLGFFMRMPEKTQAWITLHPGLFCFLFTLSFLLLCSVFCARFAMIGAIRLYQHYAHEDIRRRCLFKPTCSEYAILALRKYGVIIGGIKAADRLFRRCAGNIYRIDYP